MLLEIGEQRRAVMLHGFSSPPAALADLPLAAGLFPPDQTWMEDGGQAVISLALARLLADSARPASLIGDQIPFAEGSVEVVAVSAGENRGALAAAAPFATDERLLAGHPEAPLPTMLLRAHRVEDVLQLRDSAVAWLEQQPGNWSGKVNVMVMQARLAQVQQGMLVFKLLMGSITGIALVVGGVGIMNVLLAAVVERTREIGIRKAVGARQVHIMTQFLSESVTIAVVGSTVGIALGLSAAAIASAVMRFQTDAPVYPAVSVGSIAVSALAAIVVGLVFGTYPAIRAARLEQFDGDCGHRHAARERPRADPSRRCSG